ncbi:hypothetical protein JD79_04148 [Geodermatophilus normandii]|uniref:Uncharacterized protein n=1 Tax=Geodermatophilus normandii TaxID=1137989 RepID=A0A317QPN7_9ACTN|nr:hypothetical protein JD79_04148 [Geodermatophilus normandii]
MGRPALTANARPALGCGDAKTHRADIPPREEGAVVDPPVQVDSTVIAAALDRLRGAALVPEEQLSEAVPRP